MIHSLYLNRGLNWMLNKALSQHVCIFTLHRPAGPHGLNGVDLDMLESLLKLLTLHGCEFISVDSLLTTYSSLNPARNYVCFTVDDGYEDKAELLIPLLLKYDAKPTLFVITDLVDGYALPWDAQITTTVLSCEQTRLDAGALGVPGEKWLSLKDRRFARRYLSLHAKRLEKNARIHFVAALKDTLCASTPIDDRHFTPTSWERLAQLEQQGLTVGSHTCSHSPLSTLTREDIASELAQSKAILNSHLSAPSAVFCYPVGMLEDFDERGVEAVQEAGFVGALTSEPGYFVSKAIKSAAFTVPRLSLPASLNTAVRYTSWLEKLRAG